MIWARLVKLGFPVSSQDKQSLWNALRNYGEGDAHPPEDITADNLAAVVTAMAKDRTLPVPGSPQEAVQRRFNPDRCKRSRCTSGG